MSKRSFGAILLALGILPIQVDAAQILVVGQDRRVAASAFVVAGGDSDDDQRTEVAPDTGPFDVSIFVEAVLPEASASATGEQTSSIDAVSVRAEGLATGEALTVDDAIAYAFAQSNVALRFAVDEMTDYTLDGFVEATENATGTVQLSRPFETIAW
jgi:hypothetical protein